MTDPDRSSEHLPDRRRELILLFGSVGAFFLSISMLIPTLPLYLESLGAGPVRVGVVIGIFSIGVLVVRPAVGKAVDERGRRPVLILGAALALVASPLYGLWTAVAGLVAVRLVHGAGLSAFTSASTTIVADFAPHGRRTEFLGYFSTAGIVAFALGPVAGIELVNRAGYGALFAAVAACALAATGLAALMRCPKRRRDDDRPVDYRAALLRREVVIPTVTLLLVTIAHGGTFAFAPLLLEERLGFNIGLFFLAYAGASLVVRLAAGPISRLWGDGPMVWGGLITYAAGLFVLPFVAGWSTMALAATLMGVGFGVYQPAVYAFAANVAAERTRGMVFSAVLAAFDLGMSLGGLVAGPLVAFSGIPAMLFALSVLPIAAAAVFLATLGVRPVCDTPPVTEEVVVA